MVLFRLHFEMEDRRWTLERKNALVFCKYSYSERRRKVMYKFQQTLASLLQRTYPNRIGCSGGILTLARDRK